MKSFAVGTALGTAIGVFVGSGATVIIIGCLKSRRVRDMVQDMAQDAVDKYVFGGRRSRSANRD